LPVAEEEARVGLVGSKRLLTYRRGATAGHTRCRAVDAAAALEGL